MRRSLLGDYLFRMYSWNVFRLFGGFLAFRNGEGIALSSQRLRATRQLRFICWTLDRILFRLHYRVDDRFPIGGSPFGRRAPNVPCPRIWALEILEDSQLVLEVVYWDSRFGGQSNNILDLYPSREDVIRPPRALVPVWFGHNFLNADKPGHSRQVTQEVI